jgi:hypothetical protein
MQKIVLGIFGALSLLSVCAQPVPKLNSIGTEWIQRGTAATLNFTGEQFANAREIIISGDPGVTAKIIPAASPSTQIETAVPGISTAAPQNSNALAVQLMVATNATLADREVRVVTPDGVIESAQALTLPAAVNGNIGSAAQIDYFKFNASKSEHVIFNVYAYRMGTQLDSSLAVLDKNGKELARAEDTAGLDSILDFNVPESGEYILALRDYRYQGGGNFKYRMLGGVLPQVSLAFPFGGQRGQTVEVALSGVNLENASKLVLNLAPEAPVGRQEIRAASSKGLSNPFPFDISDLPQFMEKEPNSALDQADPVSLPVAINGRIGKEGDYDAFKFHAEKDQQFIFDLEGSRFGSSLDALLTLTDASGTIIQRNDDSAGAGADARIDQRFSEAGDYHIIVEDLLGRGGENFAYRLTVSTPKPDFTVAFLPDAPRIHQGGRVPVRCEITRQNGFGELVKLDFEGLPSGIYSSPVFLSADTSATIILLNASPDAKLGSFPLRLVARSLANGKEIIRHGQPSAGDRIAKAGFVTVLEAAPFNIQPATLMASIEQNQSGKIDVLVDRKSGFTGEIKITPEGFSAGRDPITRSFDVQALTVKPSEVRGAITMKTKLDSEIGTRPVILKAEATVNGQTITEYSPLLPLATSQIPFLLTTTMKRLVITAIPPGSSSSAAEALLTVKAERRAGFGGEIALKIEGVPEGVTATLDKIPANGGESILKVVASDKAPGGKEFQLTITGTGVFNDRNYKYQPPQVALAVNTPEAAETTPKLAGAK